MEKKVKIALIGCGNIGRACAERLGTKVDLFLYDHHVSKAKQLEEKGFGRSFLTLEEAALQADYLILAVKQKSLNKLSLNPAFKVFQGTIVSVLAGTTLSSLKQFFPNQIIVRMMLNLAVIYGEGLIALASEKELDEENKKKLEAICTILGRFLWIGEEKFDAFTALAGSGPAFVFSLVEAIIDSGIAMGFNAEESKSLVYQMMKGSLHLLTESGKHPGELKWQIASPQGTTIAGLRQLEASAVRGGLMSTFMAAYERSCQLAE